MKNIKLKVLTVFILIMAILTSACSFGGDNNDDKPSGVTINYYYLDKTKSTLKTELKSVPEGNDTEVIKGIFDNLKGQPVLESLVSVVPEKIELKSSLLKDGALVLNLTKDYNDLKAGEELLCRASIVWTFTELENVDSVEIKVEGVAITKTNGEAMGPMTRDDVVIDKPIDTQPTNIEVLTLYFGDENATELVSEARTVEVNPNQPLERYVVEQLIAGPTTKGHIRTIPAETKIRDIETADGVCYLDLSAEFVNKHNGGSTGELMTIFSIVNSLCELEHIDSVQFLIEGEKQDEFKGHVNFSNPFEADYEVQF